ncbi:hypothetical protein ACHMW6_02645 [Pseudoduganella sp. UC29_106]|uniref:hypothetical protein n=1 Tax=Pseudoduganella sp. UC29_106 TaxID=3374553 RepID=UPI0037563063
MSKLHYSIRVPSDLLESLGEFTGQCWSDSLALEPFICEAIPNYLGPAPATQAQPAAASGTVRCHFPLCQPAGQRQSQRVEGHLALSPRQRGMAACRYLPFRAECGDIALDWTTGLPGNP